MPTGRCISVIWRGSTSRPTSTRAICAAAGATCCRSAAATIKARKEGVSPKEIIDRYHNLIKRSFERLGMSFDIYSRTSSPVRVPRDPVTLMHPQTAGLFPAGEGAGYAGGIISAALDGERIAEAVTNYIK